MGKKQKATLGKALIRARFGPNVRSSKSDNTGFIHTSELPDGYDWGKLNLQSVTEQNHLDDFLATAELAGTEFAAEKLNITFVNPDSTIGVLTSAEKQKVSDVQKENIHLLKIPRRPKWDRSMAGDELQAEERQCFLEWRKTLSELQEIDGIVMTPYEKNLEFWRQLWRVIERSDVVVQILDSRHPLLFRCEDLENYVKEVSADKMNVLLLNKADLLNESQRRIWAQYFADEGVKVAFYSATSDKKKRRITEESESGISDYESSEEGLSDKLQDLKIKEKNKVNEEEHILTAKLEPVTSSKTGIVNDPTILNKEELIDFFKSLYTGPKDRKETVIGLVGYPNVGKSSTINSLLLVKKVSVSATPGKTKHFQTIFIDEDLMLCDCPGLVMPSFVSTKAEMVIWGILPIDQMRDHVGPINQVAIKIPRRVLEDLYGINLPKPLENEDPDRPPTAEELLDSHGFMRGFMNARGLPDHPRASRYILKDFVNGRLLYCNAPPTIPQDEFHTFPEKKRHMEYNPIRQFLRIRKTTKQTPEVVDDSFFKRDIGMAHSKGKANVPGETHNRGVVDNLGSISSLATATDKPWKKHHKRNKREKLRNVYAHLDE